MRVIVLVTLSFDQPIYNQHLQVWREFAHNHPDINTYFVTSTPNCTRTTCLDNLLITPGEEGYPNKQPSGARLEKTVDAIEWIEEPYDFLIRTGLSSIWIYSNLISFLETLPKTNVYCGIDGGGFVSGAGIVMSKDVCDLLVTHREVACSMPNEEDVKLGHLMKSLGIPQTAATRIDICSSDHYKTILIPKDAYHFRVKFHISDPVVRSQEVIVMRELLQRFKTIGK